MRTPLDQFHSDAVTLLEVIASQIYSMLLVQDVILILWFQLGLTLRHCTP